MKPVLIRARFLAALAAGALLCCCLIVASATTSETETPPETPAESLPIEKPKLETQTGNLYTPVTKVVDCTILPPSAEPEEAPVSETPAAEEPEPEQDIPAEPTTADPAPVEPAPAEPASAEPASEEPAPAEPEAKDDLTYLDTFIATAYTVTGTTATGTYTTAGRTLAVNPGIIPYGTHVWLYLEDGTLVGDYYAEDTGSNMMAHPYVIDIYMGENTYDECIQWGARRVLVYTEATDEN